MRQCVLMTGLYLPPHSIDLIVGLSRQISVKASHLSLDLIDAFLEHFQAYSPQQKEYGLLYIQPWIAQMETQLRSGSADFNETSKDIKSILRAFVRLTYEKPQVFHVHYILTFSWHGTLIFGQLLGKQLNWLAYCWSNFSTTPWILDLAHSRRILLQGFCLLALQPTFRAKSLLVFARYPHL
jgi:hypothetical protein